MIWKFTKREVNLKLRSKINLLTNSFLVELYIRFVRFFKSHVKNVFFEIKLLKNTAIVW